MVGRGSLEQPGHCHILESSCGADIPDDFAVVKSRLERTHFLWDDEVTWVCHLSWITFDIDPTDKRVPCKKKDENVQKGPSSGTHPFRPLPNENRWLKKALNYPLANQRAQYGLPLLSSKCQVEKRATSWGLLTTLTISLRVCLFQTAFV
jgi:hypothetical protein